MFHCQSEEPGFGEKLLSDTFSFSLLVLFLKRSKTATTAITTMKIIANVTDKATVKVFDLPFICDLVLSKRKLRR